MFLFRFVSHRRCCLCNEVTPTEKVLPLATGFYNLQFTILVKYLRPKSATKR